MRTERFHLGLAGMTAAAVLAAPVGAQVIRDELPEPARDLDVVERLGERVPLDLELVDDTGRPVTLGSYFEGERPVVLVLGYYDCPLLCGVLFDGVAKSLAALDYEPGEDYQIVVVSFDETNTTDQAFERKAQVLETFEREVTPSVRSGFAFHTTSAANARRLADSVGYQYKYQRKIDEYSHGAVIMMLTPEGDLARYLFGLTFAERDLRLALLEASDGKIASGLGDYFLHRCFTWDPDAGGYALAAFQVMRFGAALGAVLLGVLIGALLLGERRRAARRARSVAGEASLEAMG